MILMKDTTSLIFTGDIGFDRYMDGRWEDEGLIAPEILAFLSSADHVVANVEGPLISGRKSAGGTGAKQLIHTMDPAVGKVLDRMGADIWNICNNHIMDAGPEGLESTIDQARAHGARTIGAGPDSKSAARPIILPEAGGIGLFGVGYQRACRPAGENTAGCLSWSDMEAIKRNIDEIRSSCRWCVVVCHGGEEFTALPSPYTRDRYLKYLDMGADVVVCHHPHVPMNYELRGEKAIFYSLGNFIFDTDYQRAQFNTEKGVLLKVTFTAEGFSFEPMGIRIDRGTERVVPGELPAIFSDVPEGEYELLAPLAAKMFIAATKRQQIYLYPDKYRNADEEKWRESFADPKRGGRVPGEALDFAVICPLAELESRGDWKRSALSEVKEYILEQM